MEKKHFIRSRAARWTAAGCLFFLYLNVDGTNAETARHQLQEEKPILSRRIPEFILNSVQFNALPLEFSKKGIPLACETLVTVDLNDHRPRAEKLKDYVDRQAISFAGTNMTVREILKRIYIPRGMAFSESEGIINVMPNLPADQAKDYPLNKLITVPARTAVPASTVIDEIKTASGMDFFYFSIDKKIEHDLPVISISHMQKVTVREAFNRVSRLVGKRWYCSLQRIVGDGQARYLAALSFR